MPSRYIVSVGAGLMFIAMAATQGHCAMEFGANTALSTPSWNQTHCAPQGGYATVSFQSASTYVCVLAGDPNGYVLIQFNMEIGCDEAQVVDWDRGSGAFTLNSTGEFRRDAHGAGVLAGSDDLVAGSYHATSFADIYQPGGSSPAPKTVSDTHPFGVVAQQQGGVGGGGGSA